MTLLQSKQVSRLFQSYIRVSGFTAAGADDVVTTAITTALSTAGDGGVSVPLQVFSASQVGVVTTGANNRIEIYNATTKAKILTTGGNEVYGRLTESSNVYTLTYYELASGVETAYTFASTSIDFEFVYQFDFYRVPAAFAIGVTTRNISQDPASSGGSVFREPITVTGTNTLNNLTKTPITSVALVVNGLTESTVDGTPAFSVLNKVITWSASNAGYSLATTDKVTAVYSTNE